MRITVINYLKEVIQNHTVLEPVYEIGSFRVRGQEERANMRPYFPGKVFVGCDMRQGPGVDCIENVETLSLADNTVGTMLCLDTLEHVENVHTAMKEMHRVLVQGGLIVISSVMKFPIHDYPSDYWRFTPKAFEFLLKIFSKFEVVSDGEPKFPTGVYGFGIK